MRRDDLLQSACNVWAGVRQEERGERCGTGLGAGVRQEERGEPRKAIQQFCHPGESPKALEDLSLTLCG